MTEETTTNTDKFLEFIQSKTTRRIAGLLFVITILLFIWRDWNLDTNLKINDDKFSAFGEFIGGTFGTLIAGVTLILVYKTYLSQKQELADQRMVFVHNQIQDMIYREIEFFNKRVSEISISDFKRLSGQQFTSISKAHGFAGIIYDEDIKDFKISYGSKIGWLNCDFINRSDFMDCKKYLESVNKSLENIVLDEKDKEEYWVRYIDHLNSNLMGSIYEIYDLWKEINTNKSNCINDIKTREIFTKKYDLVMKDFEVFLKYRPSNN